MYIATLVGASITLHRTRKDLRGRKHNQEKAADVEAGAVPVYATQFPVSEGLVSPPTSPPPAEIQSR